MYIRHGTFVKLISVDRVILHAVVLTSILLKWYNPSEDLVLHTKVRCKQFRWSCLKDSRGRIVSTIFIFFTPDWKIECLYEIPRQVCVRAMILRWLLGPVCLLLHALLVYGHIDPANWLKLGNLKQEMMTFGLLNFHQKRLRDWSYKVIRFTSKQTIDFRENFPVLLTIELVQNSEYTLKDIAHLSNEYCFI